MAQQMIKRIRFLKNVGFSGRGFITRPIQMDDKYIYYYDEERRYCYLDLESEGIDFEFVGENIQTGKYPASTGKMDVEYVESVGE